MSGASWALWAAGAIALLLVAAWVYRTREPKGRGRLVLAILHGSIVAAITLLLMDPSLPLPGVAMGAPRILLDASLSMTVPIPGSDSTRWQRAVAQAQSLARGGAPVILFGGAPNPVPADSLPSMEPASPTTRLVPALRAAAEAGGRRLIILTDGGIEDAAEAARWIPRLGIEVDYRVVADAGPNRALVEMHAPRWAEAGQPLEISFGLSSTITGTDSIRVSVSAADTTLARVAVAAPEPGRVTTGILRFIPQGSGEWIRYEVRIEGDDPAPDDDARSAYVLVSDRPTGVALVSLRPDWEPRFLQPVLQQALGLPVRGYLRTRGDAFVRLGAGLEAGVGAQRAEVERAMREAQLVVLHGLDAASPDWIVEVAARARRLLVLPAGNVTGLGLPVRVGSPQAAEWYPVSNVPPSPIAPLLSGIDVSLAPPLPELAVVEPGPGTWTPLLATRGRRGEPAPLMIAGQTGGRRWAVALGTGYWRWSFRGGSSRQLYARLWSAIGGWLLREQGAVNLSAVRPAEPVVARGTAIRWVAPGLAADSVRLRVTRADGIAAMDTVVFLTADSAATAPLPPSRYEYEATAWAADSVAGTGAGEITVESWSPEFHRPVTTLASRDVMPSPDDEVRRWAGRPLHTTPWPYAILLALLCLLWVLRRRWGLR